MSALFKSIPDAPGSILDTVMDHECKYVMKTQLIEKTSNGTRSKIVIACDVCGRLKPRTPKHAYVTIRKNFDEELTLGNEITQEGDVDMERPLTCDWMNYVPLSREGNLYIRESDIKKTNCDCTQCRFLKSYVDFVED